MLGSAIDTTIVLTENVEQPSPLPRYSSYIHYTALHSGTAPTPEDLPLPDDDIQHIIDRLETDEQYALFAKEYCSHMLPKTPWTFLNTYAYSPAEFQSNGWKGPCNAYAEMACEVGVRHGKHMYLLAMWPNAERKTKKGETLDDYKHAKAWHIVAFYKKRDYTTREERYVIFDNDTLCEPEPGTTLDAWADEQGYEIISPLGGVIAWKRPSKDWRSALGRHMQPTLREEDIETTVVGQPLPILAGS